MKPLILINFKLYPEAIGRKSITLAQKIASVKTNKFQIAVAPPTIMLEEVAKAVKIPVFAQHADPYLEGAHTGSISVEDLKKIKVKGTILNHSEHKIPLKQLKETIKLCQKEKLMTVVCASSLSEVKTIAALKPNYLAYEPPELIGGDISVTNAKPKIIRDAVIVVQKISPKTKVLCGAGVQSKDDVRKALQLGTEGVLIGHAVPKAKDPQKFLERMIE